MFAKILCIMFALLSVQWPSWSRENSNFGDFSATTASWNQNVSAQSGDDSETGKDEQKSHMIVVTDACLPVLASGESSISARVLINYALPMKKV